MAWHATRSPNQACPVCQAVCHCYIFLYSKFWAVLQHAKHSLNEVGAPNVLCPEFFPTLTLSFKFYDF